MSDKPNTHYLNTDLDVVCDVDPTVLTLEFEARNLFTHVHHGEDDRYYVICEDCNDEEPEPNLKRLLDAIGGLSDSARKIWNRSSKREFNVGYECGDEPWSFNQGISNETLRRIAESGASFRITLYPHRPDATGSSEVFDSADE